jgi:hypothetical protein
METSNRGRAGLRAPRVAEAPARRRRSYEPPRVAASARFETVASGCAMASGPLCQSGGLSTS